MRSERVCRAETRIVDAWVFLVGVYLVCARVPSCGVAAMTDKRGLGYQSEGASPEPPTSASAPANPSAATTDAAWERLIDRLTAIGDGHLADRTITPGEAQMLLARIGSLQVWALNALAREVTRGS